MDADWCLRSDVLTDSRLQASKQFKILAYDKNKATIANATLFTAFSYTPLPDNYATFYDDSQQNWSMRFDKADDVGPP